jgi:hypothetical protein
MKAQAEMIAILGMAVLLALMTALLYKYIAVYQQTRQAIDKEKQEIYNAVLSGWVRGYVDTSTNTVYMMSGIDLNVYAVFITNGTSVLWSSGTTPPATGGIASGQVVMVLGSVYYPVYQGDLAPQVASCRYFIELVTDRGLLKWCPSTQLLIKTLSVGFYPMSLYGLKVYIPGNFSYIPVNSSLSTTITIPSGSSGSGSVYGSLKTVLYPPVVFYDPVFNITESWSGSVVNLTFKNTLTGTVKWIAIDVVKGTSTYSPTNVYYNSPLYANYWYFPSPPNTTIPCFVATSSLIFSINLTPSFIDGGMVLILSPDLAYNSKLASGVTLSSGYTGASLLYFGRPPPTAVAVSYSYSNNNANLTTSPIFSNGLDTLTLGIVYPGTGAVEYAVFKLLYPSYQLFHNYVFNTTTGGLSYSFTGSNPSPYAYFYSDSYTGRVIADNQAGWSYTGSKAENLTSDSYTLVLTGSYPLPSGFMLNYTETASIGVVYTTQSSQSTATPPPAPTTTAPITLTTTITTPPPPPPSSYQWVVEVSPIPTGPDPIPINITVYTTQNLSNPGRYFIKFDIINLNTGGRSTLNYNPVALSSGGYGYTLSLDGNYRYEVNVFVYYNWGSVDQPIFIKYDIRNYA